MTPFQISLEIDTEIAPDLTGLLSETAEATLRHVGLETPAALSLLLTDDETLRALNRRYRGIDKTTDVLSFPEEDLLNNDEPRYLGDIAISVAQARRQAAQGQHPLAAELQLLTVHGVLHLLGYDHEEPEAKAQMWALQATVLSHLNAPITLPYEPEEPA